MPDLLKDPAGKNETAESDLLAIQLRGARREHGTVEQRAQRHVEFEIVKRDVVDGTGRSGLAARRRSRVARSTGVSRFRTLAARLDRAVRAGEFARGVPATAWCPARGPDRRGAD